MSLPLPLEAVLVLEEDHQLLALLPDIDALIFAVSVDVLKVLQSLDGEDVLFALQRHPLRSRLDQVVEQGERLVDVAPVFAVVVEPFPDHAHDLTEGNHVVGKVGDLRHKGRRRAPGVVGSGLSDFLFRVRVVVYHVLHLPAYGGARHGGGRDGTHS